MWSVELIPLSIRGPANALATAANWLSNFVVIICTPFLFTNEKWRTYIVFAVFNAAIIPTIYYFYPETGGRSLEEVDIVFKAANDKGNPWFSVDKAAQEEPKWFDKNGDPTDSYGSSERGDFESEKVITSSNEISPDSAFRNPRSSDEPSDFESAAPAPVIRRSHSDGRDAGWV